MIDTSQVLAHAHRDDRLFQLVLGRSSFKPFSSTLLTLTLRKRLRERETKSRSLASFLTPTAGQLRRIADLRITDIVVRSNSAVPPTVCCL